MARRRDDLLQGTLDVMILKTLEAGPHHGYAIARLIFDRSDEALRVEEGSLYPALHRLERNGDLEAFWDRSESNRRAKFYRLTRSGRTRLRRDVERWESVSGAVSRVLGTPRPSAT